MRFADATRIEELANWTKGWCVSVYLPSHPVSDDSSADTLRLRNLLRAAETELVQLGVRTTHAAGIVADAVPQELLDPTSGVFHKAGVAVFSGSGLRRAYRHNQGGMELFTAASRFHLRPLLAELAHDHHFFVLALTRGSARLWRGNRDRLAPVEVPDMPESLEDAIRYDEQERELVSHSAARRGGGGIVAAFHGQGDGADHLPEDLSRFLRMVDAAVARRVPPDTRIVPAGSLDVIARYRDLTGRLRLTDAEITGNPQTIPVADLHRQAWEIVDSEATGSPDDVLAEFRRLDGTGRASADPVTVIEAARHGRVASMVVGADVSMWGRCDAGVDDLVFHESRMPGDEDLIDGAAVDAWKTGASVRVVPSAELPRGLEIAAVFRY